MPFDVHAAPGTGGDGTVTGGDNGVELFGTTIRLGHSAAGSGASDFTADRFLFTDDYKFTIGGTAGNNGFVYDGSTGNISVGSAATSPTAIFELNSTSKGFLTPRLTTAQKNAISSPATGLLVFDTDLGLHYYYNGSNWVNYSTGSPALSSVTAMVANTSVNHSAFTLNYTWNSITTNTAVTFSSTSLTTGTLLSINNAGTVAASGAKNINSTMSGANASANVLSYAGYFSNTKTHGTRTDNRGIYSTVLGGTTFYSHAAEFVGPNGAGFYVGDRGDSTRAAIWATAVGTPSAVNYALVADAVHTVMNGTSNVELCINDTKLLRAEALGVHIGSANLSPVSAICSFIAPTASANKGLVSLGNGTTTWTGGANAFAGSANGTYIAINAVGAYSGHWINAQKAGVSTFTLDSDGIVSKGTWGTGAVIGGVTMTLGSDATGDVYYRNSGGVLTRLAAGADGTVLTLASGLPTWAAAGGSTTLDTLGAIAANATKTQGNFTLAWNWTTNTTTNPVTWTGAALTTGTLLTLSAGSAITGIALRTIGHSGGGLAFGNYNSTLGAIWSNAIATPSTSNYAFVADSTTSALNGTSNVTLKIADSTRLRVESTGINIGNNSSPVSIASCLVAPTASANIGLFSIGTGGFAGASFGTIGNANGTFIAINAILGSTADLFHAAVNSATKFKVDSNGLIYTASVADLFRSTAAMTDYAGVSAGSLANAPVAGDPSKWIRYNDNGTARYIPSW